MQLVINTPGTFITQKDVCFPLKQKEKVLDVSTLKVESIVIPNQVTISTQAAILSKVDKTVEGKKLKRNYQIGGRIL